MTAVQAVVQPPVAIGAPSPASCALAFERGADLAGLMSQLRLALGEIKHALAEIIASTPQGDPSLRSLTSFMRRLCGFLGEVFVFDPSTGG
jgi:hypothetical protein